jgi:hypothetical protein
MKQLKFYLLLGSAVALLAGCLDVEIQHSPVIAKKTEAVTYTATVKEDGDGPCDVDIYVNGALVKTCNGLVSGDTCTFTGGPYASSWLANYRVVATDSDGDSVDNGTYYFGITDAGYNWLLDWIPARWMGDTLGHEDLVFHKATDYASFDSFVDDVEDKIYDVYNKQDIISRTENLDKFNFYVYSKNASSSGCGTVHTDADMDMPWRDDDAVLHTSTLGDCTNSGLTHFSAEGHNTKAFLHESGHAVFGLADEYDWCYTWYFAGAVEPNIFPTEAACRAEQIAKGRDPDACYQFTTCQGGWWGIHDMTIPTVMQRGMVGDPWGIEAAERVEWVFDQY